jgi:hypothetical protein
VPKGVPTETIRGEIPPRYPCQDQGHGRISGDRRCRDRGPLAGPLAARPRRPGSPCSSGRPSCARSAPPSRCRRTGCARWTSSACWASWRRCPPSRPSSSTAAGATTSGVTAFPVGSDGSYRRRFGRPLPGHPPRRVPAGTRRCLSRRDGAARLRGDRGRPGRDGHPRLRGARPGPGRRRCGRGALPGALGRRPRGPPPLHRDVGLPRDRRRRRRPAAARPRRDPVLDGPGCARAALRDRPARRADQLLRGAGGPRPVDGRDRADRHRPRHSGAGPSTAGPRASCRC